jgi:hypothetical protein
VRRGLTFPSVLRRSRERPEALWAYPRSGGIRMEALAGVGGIEAYAFAMGVAAVFNPCGVALLPASLAWVGGTAVEAGSAGARMVRGLVAGLLMALGFTAVVAVLAAALHGLGAVIGTILHPAMIVLAALIMVGGGLVAFGLLYVPVDRLVTWRGTTTRSLHWTWLLAGVVYGVAELHASPLYCRVSSSPGRRLAEYGRVGRRLRRGDGPGAGGHEPSGRGCPGCGSQCAASGNALVKPGAGDDCRRCGRLPLVLLGVGTRAFGRLIGPGRDHIRQTGREDATSAGSTP